MLVEIIRIESSEDGVFGLLRLDGRAQCLTLEPPDRGNTPNVSCIPAGRYVCRRVRSPRFGETFEVAEVPGRSHILLHAGNTGADTEGCILLGSRLGRVEGRRGVLASAEALRGFLEATAGRDGLDLAVIDAAASREVPA